ncbi:MAG: metallophosphoesterase [Melioribacteraceae bacterium]
MDRRKFIKRSLVIGGGALLLSSYPIFIERYLIKINTYKIPITNLPKEFEGFRIVHLTDLHYGFLVPEMIINYIVEKTNSLNKDAIFLTGDYVHAKNTTKEIDIVWPILNKLEARYGVYNVLGNHDHWADTDKSLQYLNKSGQNIQHIAKAIQKGDSKIWIGGTGDLWEDKIEIDKTFQKVPESDTKLLLAHNPDTADLQFETNVDLILSGHTHGGQVNIPFIGTPVLPVKNKNYSSGFIKTKHSNLFISRGIGWAVLPVRFNCSPEIAILELTKKVV